MAYGRIPLPRTFDKFRFPSISSYSESMKSSIIFMTRPVRKTANILLTKGLEVICHKSFHLFKPFFIDGAHRDDYISVKFFLDNF